MFRIGTLLLNQGLIDERQLHEALKRQQQLKAQGRVLPLGQILIDMRIVTEPQIRAALQLQRTLNERAAMHVGPRSAG